MENKDLPTRQAPSEAPPKDRYTKYGKPSNKPKQQSRAYDIEKK